MDVVLSMVCVKFHSYDSTHVHPATAVYMIDVALEIGFQLQLEWLSEVFAHICAHIFEQATIF